MLVNKNSDINIYKERVQDEENSSSCCGTKIPVSETNNAVANIDFNEWVGMYILSFCLLSSRADIAL